VCELVQVLDLSQPKISKHIAKIRQIDLVATKRNEQYIYYSLNKNDMNYYSILEETVKECRKNDLFKNDIIELNKIDSFVCRGN
jgi:ArsR family transcriptional regulator